MITKSKKDKRVRRHNRIRKKLKGTPERPRLAIYRSLNHLYLQVIDDMKEKTLLSFSSLDKDFKAPQKANKTKVSQQVGEQFAAKLKKKGISKVAFDRGGFLYHGRIKAAADSLRKGGVEF